MVSNANDVGTITRASLLAILPELMTIRRDGRGKLYVVSPWSAWHMAGEQGQIALRSAVNFHEAPAAAPVQAPPPAIDAPAAPPAAVAENLAPPKSERGIFDFFGDFD